MNKLVFITGSTGFIGSQILEYLISNNYSVIRGVRSQNLAENEVYCDLSDPNQILNLKNKFKPEIVIHFGAKIGWATNDENDLYNPNVLATACLVYLTKAWGAKFIFASAAIIHGIRNENIDSDSEVKLDNYYAHTKWLAEQIIMSAKIDYAILRIGGVFGYKGPKHLGINDAINKAIKGNKPKQVGDGKLMRNYIYVKDLANFVLSILENNYSGTYYVASNHVISIQEMMQHIYDIFFNGEKVEQQKSISVGNHQVIKPSGEIDCKFRFKQALEDIKKISQL